MTAVRLVAVLAWAGALIPATRAQAQDAVPAHEQSARHGDVSVRIGLARVQPLAFRKEIRVTDVNSALEREAQRLAEERGTHYLHLAVSLTNTSSTRKVDFTPWSFELGHSETAKVKDIHGNTYSSAGHSLRGDFFKLASLKITDREAKDLSLPVYKYPDFTLQSTTLPKLEWSIHPGKSTVDVLLFERPIDKTEFLLVDLPCRNFGSAGKLTFKVVRGMWDGSVEREAAAAARASAAAKQQQAKAQKAQEQRQRDERAKAEAAAPARREQLAASSLALTKQLISAGKTDTVQTRLARLIVDYPETEAAKEARELLKKY